MIRYATPTYIQAFTTEREDALPEGIILPVQTHSCNVAVVCDSLAEYPETDALVTDQAGVMIGIRTADCVPVLLYDDVRHVVAAVHAGWRTPTQAEWAELMNEANCTWEETTQNEVPGDFVTSKKTGNSIFLPKNRVEYGQGAYWSSSLYDDTSSKFNGPFGWEFRFYPVTYYELIYGARFSGYGIRPVCR